MQGKPKGEIIVHEFDLADFSSIKNFVTYFKSMEKVLNLLVLNAGTAFPQKT